MFSKVLSLPSPTLLLRYYFHPQLLNKGDRDVPSVKDGITTVYCLETARKPTLQLRAVSS